MAIITIIKIDNLKKSYHETFNRDSVFLRGDVHIRIAFETTTDPQNEEETAKQIEDEIMRLLGDAKE